jgi:hypothetical protein
MYWIGALFGLAIVLSGEAAFAGSRLTDPVKIARECKGEIEFLCKGVRPGRQRVTSCLRGRPSELSPACSAALKSTE